MVDGREELSYYLHMCHLLDTTCTISFDCCVCKLHLFKHVYIAKCRHADKLQMQSNDGCVYYTYLCRCIGCIVFIITVFVPNAQIICNACLCNQIGPLSGMLNPLRFGHYVISKGPGEQSSTLGKEDHAADVMHKQPIQPTMRHFLLCIEQNHQFCQLPHVCVSIELANYGMHVRSKDVLPRKTVVQLYKTCISVTVL